MEAVKRNPLTTILFASIPTPDSLCCFTVDIPQKDMGTRITSLFHQQIIKCRCLIFSNNDILAAPILGVPSKINVLMSRDQHSHDRVQLELKKQGMKVCAQVPLSNSIYEACIRYTMIARLAPYWNQVDKYLVHGRDFLTTSGPQNAVKLDVVVNEGEVSVVVWPISIHLSKMKLEDIVSEPKFIQQFLSQPHSTIPQLFLDNYRTCVLPSMKEAEIISVSRQIPQTCPFSSYKELKRHWKNSYGYRLAECPEDVIYYTVGFQPFMDTFFTYPHFCLQPHQLMLLQRVDHVSVLKMFLSDLNRKFPDICGQPFGVNSQWGYALSKLYQSNESLTRPNLSYEPAAQHLKPVRPSFLPCTSFSLEPHTQMPSSLPQNTKSNKEWDFTSKAWKVTHPSEVADVPKQTKASSLSLQHPSYADTPPRFFPRSTPVLAKPSGEAGRPKTTIVPIFKRKVVNRPPSVATSTETSSELQPVPSSETSSHQKTKPFLSGIMFNTLCHNSQEASKVKGKTQQGSTKRKKVTETSGNEGSKTSSQERMLKKPRNRPQVQHEMDVEDLARKKLLVKTNTATLVAWLRERGVSCKVKEKKPDLVEKVEKFLNIT